MGSSESYGRIALFFNAILPEQRQRILITGGTGLLGLNWAAAMRDTHDVWLGTHRHRVSLRGVASTPLALDDATALAGCLRELRPDIVVHAAGLSSVDDCERDPAAAARINSQIAGSVAAAVAGAGMRLVHISTDHLFDGARALYTEADAPVPLNAYARSKLDGERAVAARCPGALILRTNFYGWGHASRQSFSDWILEALRAGRPLRMFDDVYFTPILATRLARAAHRLLDAGAGGVLHLGGDERLSKHAFALRLALGFGLPATGIRASAYAEAGLAAPRPRDMSLSNARARGILGGAPGDLPAGIDAGIAELRAQEAAGLSRELRQAVTE